MSSRFGLKFPYYIKNFTKDVKENGVKEALRRILHMRDMKYGKLVGTDKFGNKYFEDYQFEVAGRNRWVEFSKGFYTPNGGTYDASQIPPEWHGWLHYTYDDAPSVVPMKKQFYARDHEQNMSCVRQRGYGVGGVFSGPGIDEYYKQPGHLFSKNFTKYGARHDTAKPDGPNKPPIFTRTIRDLEKP